LDLLEHYPIRYIDRTRFFTIQELKTNLLSTQVKGTLLSVKEEGVGRKKRLKGRFKDDTGIVDLVWFSGIKWLLPKLKVGGDYVMYGKPTLFNNKVSFSHPELVPTIEFLNKKQSVLQAVYPSTEKLKKRGIDNKTFRTIIGSLLKELNGKIPEVLSENIINNNTLISRNAAFYQIHEATSQQALKKALIRLKFEELFYLQLRILKSKKANEILIKGHVFKEVGTLFNTFYNKCLPFELTGAQKRVIKEIRKNTTHGMQMNRLVQGDVGSGKTLVALMSMLLAIDNGFQTTLMAPTEILATQHYHGISELLQPLDITVELLTGSTKTAQRKIIHEGLENGNVHILIGTHALIEDKVKYKNLGLAVIDEQHRFGVAQRYKLWKKNITPPHILIMTATPIPRTLAMTVYGDLDTSIIDELPPGRKTIITKHYFDNQRLAVLGFMKEQIKQGRQIYIVYPLIDESETMDYKDLMDGHESISRYFPVPEYQISIVHGRMKPADKAFEMKRFEQGITQILVATTVIEVGVNVPNASVMIIESAERFGLSQLHQLRGRVGRGTAQSYCLLMTGNKLSKDAKTRIKTMVDTTDGFVISEVDMKLRGPGDIAGTRQSGLLDLKIASLVADSHIMSMARNQASKIIDTDPELVNPSNQILKSHLAEIQDNNINWGKVS
jgi:ATP-dependent DNA helicase RecG